jgi:sirohydrochlorin cobaltochelatase
MNVIRRFALAVLFLCCAVFPVTAQGAGVGTLILAHGGSTEWNDQVRAVAREVKTGGPVEVSFLMGPEAPAHRFQDMAKRLVERGAQEVVVVPLLVSSHSGHYEQIRYLVGATDSLDATMHHHLHHAGIDRVELGVPVRVSRAIDDSPEVARVLAERANALTKTPREQALFLLGHGPNEAEEYAGWMENLRPVADSVKAWTGFRDVRVGLVRDDAPAPVRAEAVRRVRELISLQSQVTGKPVVVVPVLVSRGSVTEKLRRDLEGLPVVYAGDPLLPHPGLARWIEARVRESAERAAAAR